MLTGLIQKQTQFYEVNGPLQEANPWSLGQNKRKDSEGRWFQALTSTVLGTKKIPECGYG